MFRALRWPCLLAALAFAVSASATKSGMVSSEYLHQADDGVLELTPGIGQGPGDVTLYNSSPTGFNSYPGGISFTSYSFRHSDVKANVLIVPLELGLEYGLSPMFSVGGVLAYASGSTSFTNCSSGPGCKTHSIKGMLDPILFFKGRAALGPGALSYGVVAHASLEKNKTYSSGDGNFATGGSGLTPFIAFQIPAGLGVWGARFQYDAYKSDRKQTDERSSPTSNSTESGGKNWILDTFFEAPVGIATLGGAIAYQSSAETKTSTDGSTATSDKNGSTSLSFEFYSPIHLAGATLLPSVTYQTLTYSSSQYSLSSASILQLGFAARFAF